MRLSLHLIENTISSDIKNIRNVMGSSGKKQFLNRLARKFVQMAKSTFGAGQSAYRGNGWSPYSKNYARQVGSSIPTLYRSGRLKNSIKITPVYGETIGVYSDTPYSAVQFLGGGNNIPSRKFFPLTGAGNSWKLTAAAATTLDLETTKLLSMLSSGVLPKPLYHVKREYTYGNPLQSVRGS